VRSALQFGDVLEVKARRIRRDAKDAVLELLAVTFEPAGGEDPGGWVRSPSLATATCGLRVRRSRRRSPTSRALASPGVPQHDLTAER
jgi:hypothetical protein